MKKLLAAMVAGVGLTAVSCAFGADAQWVNNLGNGYYSDGGNWDTFIPPSGADSAAAFYYDPTYNDVGANILNDMDWTIGYMLFEDLAGFGSSSMGLTIPTGGATATITMATSAGIPTISVGRLLNNEVNGKKAIANGPVILAGTDGLRKNGPGYFSIRAPVSGFTGDFVVEEGGLEFRTYMMPGYSGALRVSGGGDLHFGLANMASPYVNPLPTTTPLVLGGPLGSGTVRNNNRNVDTATTWNFSQTFSGTTLNQGAHKITVVGPTDSNTGGGSAPTGTSAIDLGLITRNAGSAAAFRSMAGLGTKRIYAANANDASGILGGWAVYDDGRNTEWARVEAGSGLVLKLTAAGYAANLWTPGSNTDVTVAQTIAGVTTHTVRVPTNATLTVQGLNVIETGGLLLRSGSKIQGTGSLVSGDASGDLIFHVYSSDTVGNAGNGGAVIAVPIVDGATPTRVVMAGTGRRTMDGAQTYSGGTIVGDGILVLGGPAGGSATASVRGDILVNGQLHINRADAFTLTNNVHGNGRLTQVGWGTLALDKGFNIGQFDQSAGRTRLNFAGAGAPATEMIDWVLTAGTYAVQSARLTLRGGALEVAGKAATANRQTFALVDVLGGAYVALTNGGSGGTLELGLHTLNRPSYSTDSGGSLKLLPSGSGVTVTTREGVADTLLTAANGVAYAIMGPDDWAAKDSANVNIVGGSTLAYFYTPSSWGIGGNVDMDVDASLVFSLGVGSLRYNTQTGTNLNVDTGAALSTGGILVTPNVGARDAFISGAGELQGVSGGATSGFTARDLMIFQNNTQGRLMVNVPVNNIDTFNGTTLVKDGPGEMVLAGAANGFSGRLIVSEGRLRSQGTINLVGNVFVRGGELVLEGNSVTYANGYVSIGQRQGDNGILTIEGNSRFNTINDAATTGYDFNLGDVNSKGVLNIRDNADLRLRNIFLGKYGNSEGIVNQHGGTVTVVNAAGGTGEMRLGGFDQYSPLARGTYNLYGGLLNNARSFQVGAYGTGFFNQTGGMYRATANWTVIGRFMGSEGTWNLSGGTVDVSTAQTAFIIGESGDGTLNVSGEGVVLARGLSVGHNAGAGVVNQSGGAVSANLTGNVTYGAVTRQGGLILGTQGAGSSGTYNLNGGTFSVQAVSRGQGSGTFNFNGGTLKPIAHNVDFMSGLTAANVQAGGAAIDTSGYDITIAQGLQDGGGNGRLLKLGAGRLTLSGVNTYGGDTIVSNGALGVEGSIAGGGAVRVAAGATLDGTGRIAGPVHVGATATLAPGASPGTLTVSNSVTFSSGAIFRVELWATNNYDRLVMTGSAITLGGATLTVDDTQVFAPGDMFTIVANHGALTGSFAGLPNSGDIVTGATSGNQFAIAYFGGDGDDITLTVIPEPAALGVAGAIALVILLRHRRRE